jgi:L-aminopeptidase/D-esterase-like protein
MMKGGFGIARLEAEGVEVAAAAVVNCIGDVVNDDGSVLAGAYAQSGEWMVERDPLRRYPRQEPPVLGTSTTLVVVATTASLNRVGCHRLAQRVHDGIALAVRPVHTTHDGDAAFVLATGIDALRLGSLTSAREARTFDMLGNMAVSATAEAIRNAVRHAVSVPGVRGLAG